MDNPTIDLSSLEAVEAALEQGQTPYDTHVLLERFAELRAEATKSAPKRRSKRNS